MSTLEIRTNVRSRGIVENRQLGGEGTLVGGPRFATGYIRREVPKLVHLSFPVQPAQHHHHQQVTCAERTVEPFATPQPTRKLAEPRADALLEDRQALLIPALLALQDHRHFQ